MELSLDYSKFFGTLLSQCVVSMQCKCEKLVASVSFSDEVLFGFYRILLTWVHQGLRLSNGLINELEETDPSDIFKCTDEIKLFWEWKMPN